MPTRSFPYMDLGGGVNRSSPAAAIGQREIRDVRNWYPYETALRRRGGVRRLNLANGAPFGQAVRSMVERRRAASADWELVVGHDTRFSILQNQAGGQFWWLDLHQDKDLTEALALVLPPHKYKPWAMAPAGDAVYAARHGTTMLVRVYGEHAWKAGMPAPTVAPVLVDGGAGSLPAGNYVGVFTDFNPLTGWESNPSPVSNTLTLGANRHIDWTTIAVSGNPFAAWRRLYRTTESSTNNYFHVDDIENNTASTYADDQVAVISLGDSVSQLNGMPPSGAYIVAHWVDRSWVASSAEGADISKHAEGSELWYSGLLKYEGFGASSVIKIGTDDGHTIRGLYPDLDRLYIMKTLGIYFLVGNSPSNFSVHLLSKGHGCLSHHSIKGVQGRVFWLGNGRKVYMTDGVSISDIGDPRVQEYLDEIPEELAEFVTAEIDPTRNWYVLSIPDSTGTAQYANKLSLVYNYKDSAWTVFDHRDESSVIWGPSALAMYHNLEGNPILASAFYDDNVCQFADPTTAKDQVQTLEATSYDSYFLTKPDDFGLPGFYKSHGEVWLLFGRQQFSDVGRDVGSIRLEAYYDDDTTARLDRTVTAGLVTPEWRPFAFPTARKPGVQLALKVTYSGDQVLDIEGINHVVHLMERRLVRPA